MSNDTLQVRRIAIDTYHENVAYLNRECSMYRAEGFQAHRACRLVLSARAPAAGDSATSSLSDSGFHL